MSGDARGDGFRTAELGGPAYARCKAQSGDVYTKLYIGTQRLAELPDEAGAIAVIECVFGGRVRIYAIPGDKENRRVEHDLLWRNSAAPHAPGDEVVAAPAKTQGGGA